MQNIEPPDSHYLSAAMGWLGLGQPTEAAIELAMISSEYEGHPDVLEVRWVIYVQRQKWQSALQAARTLVQTAPERSSGWLHQAYALRRLPEGGLQKAWDALLPAYNQFPKEATIPYNLSCYACQLQQLEEARLWLQRALKIGNKDRIKEMALDDPDLKPLWDEIRQL
jgi:tetratricopeptide (TPR) repeat protein